MKYMPYLFSFFVCTLTACDDQNELVENKKVQKPETAHTVTDAQRTDAVSKRKSDHKTHPGGPQGFKGNPAPKTVDGQSPRGVKAPGVMKIIAVQAGTNVATRVGISVAQQVPSLMQKAHEIPGVTKTVLGKAATVIPQVLKAGFATATSNPVAAAGVLAGTAVVAAAPWCYRKMCAWYEAGQVDNNPGYENQTKVLFKAVADDLRKALGEEFSKVDFESKNEFQEFVLNLVKTKDKAEKAVLVQDYVQSEQDTRKFVVESSEDKWSAMIESFLT